MRHCILLAATAILLASAPRAEAGRFFCQHCGCRQNCKKVCHLKCEKKKETTVEYTCECEDFCVPGPSKKCGVKKEHACDGHHRTILWQPTCARVHTRKKLVKKEVTKEVPDYKWVVEEYCCVCGHWVKVDRDKDKDKKESGPEKSDETGIGPSKKEKSKAAQSDRPPSPSPEGDSEDGSTSEGAGEEQLERLPLPKGDRQTRSNPAAENYRAYYLDTELDANLNLPTAAEIESSELEVESRRPIFGLFNH